jgi:hypothetical protein
MSMLSNIECFKPLPGSVVLGRQLLRKANFTSQKVGAICRRRGGEGGRLASVGCRNGAGYLSGRFGCYITGKSWNNTHGWCVGGTLASEHGGSYSISRLHRVTGSESGYCRRIVESLNFNSTFHPGVDRTLICVYPRKNEDDGVCITRCRYNTRTFERVFNRGGEYPMWPRFRPRPRDTITNCNICHALITYILIPRQRYIGRIYKESNAQEPQQNGPCNYFQLHEDSIK